MITTEQLRSVLRDSKEQAVTGELTINGMSFKITPNRLL